MQSLPQNNNKPENTLPQKTLSSSNQIDPQNGIPLKTVFWRNLMFIPSLNLKKTILGGVFIIALVATFFITTKGANVCIFSFCTNSSPDSTLIPDLWAYGGGAATIVILTSFMGIPILPAVGISAAVWFLVYSSLHLS